MYDIPVVSLTSDGAKPNRRFYSMCQQQGKGECKDVPYKTFNPFREGKDLFFFCDAPHLLKTACNCFSNSFAHSNSRKMQVPPLCFHPPPPKISLLNLPPVSNHPPFLSPSVSLTGPAALAAPLPQLSLSPVVQ